MEDKAIHRTTPQPSEEAGGCFLTFANSIVRSFGRVVKHRKAFARRLASPVGQILPFKLRRPYVLHYRYEVDVMNLIGGFLKDILGQGLRFRVTHSALDDAALLSRTLA